MSENPNISDAERDLYDLSVEEAVDEVSRAPKGDANEAEPIIQQFLNDVDMHKALAVKFRGEVLRKVADQKRKADDERERKILEKFEGQVVNKSGELRFAGTEENTKFYARAGSIFRRIFGKRYSAAEADELLRDVQKLEDDIEQSQLRLDMLKASYEASRSLIGNMRKIRKAKREGRFVVGYWDDTVASWKAAKGKKARATAEYEKDGKKEVKEINRKQKDLDKQKSIVEEIQKKVEVKRRNGRNIFEQQFGEQIKILRQMEGKDQKDEEARLRKDVREFGDDLGLVYMEYFLNEALGITPKTARVHLTKDGSVLEGGAYQVPLTEREAAEEMTVLSRWCEFVLGKAPSKNELIKLIDYMRDAEPRMLAQNLENQRTNSLSLHMLELRFLITGKDMNGRLILDESRRIKPTPENIVRLLRYADDHEALVPTDLQEVFTTFAKDWPDEYTAADFGYVFDYIKEGKEPPEPTSLSDKEHANFENFRKGLQERWIYATTEVLNEQTLYDLTEELEHRYTEDQMRHFLQTHRQFDLMKFFYTGKFAGHDIIVHSDPFYKTDNPKQFIDAFDQANSILRNENPKDEQVVEVFRKLAKESAFQRDGMKALDADLFQRLLKEVKDEETQSQATVIVNQPVQPAPAAAPVTSATAPTTPPIASATPSAAPVTPPAKSATPAVAPAMSSEKKRHIDRLARVFSFPEESKEVETIYRDTFEGNAEWTALLSNKNLSMLQLFISGELKSIHLTPPNLTGKKKMEYVENVLEILPFLSKSSIAGLEQDFKEFSRKFKKAGCEDFLNFLRTTYKDFL